MNEKFNKDEMYFLYLEIKSVILNERIFLLKFQLIKIISSNFKEILFIMIKYLLVLKVDYIIKK